MKWSEAGREPDYRFTLANERTFLAWVRTALALIAAGLVLSQLAGHFTSAPGLKWVGIALCAFAVLIGPLAYLHWKANQIAMRTDAPLPRSAALPILSAGIAILSAAALIFSALT